MITRHAGTVDDLFITATVAVGDRFGWTTFGATAQKQVLHSVNTTAGAIMTVDITRTSLSRATQADKATITF